MDLSSGPCNKGLGVLLREPNRNTYRQQPKSAAETASNNGVETTATATAAAAAGSCSNNDNSSSCNCNCNQHVSPHTNTDCDKQVTGEKSEENRRNSRLAPVQHRLKATMLR